MPKKHLSEKKCIWILYIFCICLFALTGCDGTPSGEKNESSSQSSSAKNEFSVPSTDEEIIPDTPVAASPSVDAKGSRDNTSVCLVPQAAGTVVYSNELAAIDVSNAKDGYICARYTGSCPKVKLQINFNGSDTTYKYDLKSGGYEIFPLTSGSGTYSIGIHENISGTTYSTCLYEDIAVTITDPYSPFLYPNQYVNFTQDSLTVKKAAELAEAASSDLDVVSSVYNFVVSSISYDYDKAAGIESGYVCDIDTILQKQSGICLDYAAVMASMLRSQGIPTHLEVGYAGDVYHAWISTYIQDVGWINGIIHFDGENWSLIDPTFAANSSESALKKFIGDGSNYTVKYVY